MTLRFLVFGVSAYVLGPDRHAAPCTPGVSGPSAHTLARGVVRPAIGELLVGDSSLRDSRHLSAWVPGRASGAALFLGAAAAFLLSGRRSVQRSGRFEVPISFQRPPRPARSRRVLARADGEQVSDCFDLCIDVLSQVQQPGEKRKRKRKRQPRAESDESIQARALSRPPRKQKKTVRASSPNGKLAEKDPWLWRLTSVNIRADEWFDAVDLNGDGVISFVELSEHLAAQKFKPESIKCAFDLLDLNKDGEISRAELQECFLNYEDPALRLALSLGASEADDTFDAIDTNGDGMISRLELAQFLDRGTRSELPFLKFGEEDACVATLFEMYDTNGDGFISREELRDAYAADTEFRSFLGLP